MRQSKWFIRATLIGVGLMVMFALGGCSAANSKATQEQTQNRQYMSSVNQDMDELQSRLASFNDAVSRGDVVSMRTQADNAYKALDDLKNISAPAALKDAQQDYVDGTTALKGALDEYIALYTEIDSATTAQPFDWSSYDQRIAKIKQDYDTGMGKLQDGDNLLSQKPQPQ